MAPKDYEHVYGLCGYVDGDKDNDFVSMNAGRNASVVVWDYNSMAESWRYV